MRRALGAVAGVSAAALVLSGCGLSDGLYNVTLPGGADLGSHPYSITAKFSDALDLVPQSGVKVNDVAVGRVTKITLEPNGTVADVRLEVNGNVDLPANASASIQQTSLLGEKYVALAPTSNVTPQGRLGNGDVIERARTTDGVEVEQVFGALSLLLNGGGVSQLHDIARELNQFANGNEADIRNFFASVRTVVGQLNRRRTSITNALDALNGLSSTLKANNAEIARVLTALAPGLSIVASQERQLRTLLVSLTDLSSVTVSTLDKSKQDIVANFRLLAPILSNLAAAGSNLPKSLQVLATYPFTDGAASAIKGDYFNTFIATALNSPGGDFTASAVTGTSDATPDAFTPAASNQPAGLLPATSSAGAGLPSTVSVSPRTRTGSATDSSPASPAAASTSAGAATAPPRTSGSSASGSSASGSSASGSSSAGSTATATPGAASTGSSASGSSSAGSTATATPGAASTGSQKTGSH